MRACAGAKAAGLARCPFAKESFTNKEGRNGEIANSAYGAVYGVLSILVAVAAGYAAGAVFRRA